MTREKGFIFHIPIF